MAHTEPQPEYCVFRAEVQSTVCYRAVRTNPAQVGDFISFADAGAAYPWWRMHLANGVSAWEDVEVADALASRKGYPFLVELDIVRIDARTHWARTGRTGHVTIWGLPTLLLQGVVTYVPVD